MSNRRPGVITRFVIGLAPGFPRHKVRWRKTRGKGTDREDYNSFEAYYLFRIPDGTDLRQFYGLIPERDRKFNSKTGRWFVKASLRNLSLLQALFVNFGAKRRRALSKLSEPSWRERKAKRKQQKEARQQAPA